MKLRHETLVYSAMIQSETSQMAAAYACFHSLFNVRHSQRDLICYLVTLREFLVEGTLCIGWK